MIVAVTLCALMLTISGCGWPQPGETAAEGHRRHQRIMRVAHQKMAEDIDAVFMFDGPSDRGELRQP